MSKLRTWLALRLHRLVIWLAPAIVCMPVLRDDLFHRAKVLTAAIESLDGSGEAKRHQVYARLIKDFPGRSKRDIARVIEAVL